MSLLTVIQGACQRLGIQSPSVAYASTDLQIIQLVALAQQEGKELAKRHPWQKITQEKTFTSTATEEQSSALPSDFDRMVDDTFFNRTRKRFVYGPLSPQEWQYSKSVIATTIIESWRQRGDSILLTPTPPAGDTYAFEYVSKNFCESSLGADQSSWAADTDTGLLSEELMTLGIAWRFKKSKGLDYAEDFRSYEIRVAQTALKGGGRKVVNFGKSPNKARGISIPDGNWNV